MNPYNILYTIISIHLFKLAKLLVAAKGFQVIKGIDVVEGISVKCFSNPGCGASRARGRVWIEDVGHDPHDWKLSIRADLRDEKTGELFAEGIGNLLLELLKIIFNGNKRLIILTQQSSSKFPKSTSGSANMT